MFITLLKKEFMDLIKSFRFTAGWLLVLILFVLSAILLSGDVQQKRESLEVTERNRNTFLTDYGHLNRSWYFIQPIRPPETTETLFRGLTGEGETHSFFADPIKKLFPKFDLIYIASVLLSLLAVIFTYDSICGEREEGTLKLLHSTRVSRVRILLAKWLGNWIGVGVPFIAVYLLAALTAAWWGGLTLTPDVLVELSAMAVAFLLYIGFFLCLGLFVSSLVKHSGASILILLFLWVLFALVIPQASPIVASQIRPIPSVNAVEREVQMITTHLADNRRVEEGKKLAAQLLKEYGAPDVKGELNKDMLLKLGWDSGKISRFAAEFRERYQELMNRIGQEQGAKAEKLTNELLRKIDSQTELAHWISLLTPTCSLTYFGTDLASVGLRAERHFERESRSFMQRDFSPYWDQRNGELQQKTGKAYVLDDYLNMSDRPRFQHRPEPVASRLGAALPYLGHLVICMLIVLLLAIVAYQRYDVR